MRKLGALLLLYMLMVEPVFAVQHYIMLTDFPVRKVVVGDDNVLSAYSVYTIDNEKKQTILTPKVQDGTTSISLDLDNEKKNIDVKIIKGALIFDVISGVKLYELDMPEDE